MHRTKIKVEYIQQIKSKMIYQTYTCACTDIFVTDNIYYNNCYNFCSKLTVTLTKIKHFF